MASVMTESLHSSIIGFPVDSIGHLIENIGDKYASAAKDRPPVTDARICDNVAPQNASSFSLWQSRFEIEDATLHDEMNYPSWFCPVCLLK